MNAIDMMELAAVRVRKRLSLAASSLNGDRVEYAIAGDCAVAAWVATVDESAVRNTQDVDVMIRRSDFDRAKAALEGAGFVYRHAAGLDLFLDGAGASPRQAVHLVFSGEQVRAHEPAPNPDVGESSDMGAFRVLNLDALVRIKLTAFRDKDRTHVRDLIDVGLVDRSWVARLQGVLGERLAQLLDTPDG